MNDPQARTGYGDHLLRVAPTRGFVQECELVRSAAAGAYGVILKDVSLDILVKSLRQVAEGKRLPLSSGQAAPRERERDNIAIAENVLAVLTDRERQIMGLVSEGLSNKEIGRRLNIADGTIKVHLHRVYQKLEISNRTVLAALAISQNEIAGQPPDNQGGWELRGRVRILST